MHNLAALRIISITIIRDAHLKKKKTFLCNRRCMHCADISSTGALRRAHPELPTNQMRRRREPSFPGGLGRFLSRRAELSRSAAPSWLRSRGGAAPRAHLRAAQINLGARASRGWRGGGWERCFIIACRREGKNDSRHRQAFEG